MRNRSKRENLRRWENEGGSATASPADPMDADVCGPDSQTSLAAAQVLAAAAAGTSSQPCSVNTPPQKAHHPPD